MASMAKMRNKTLPSHVEFYPPRSTEKQTGEVWAEGSYPNTVWVFINDDTTKMYQVSLKNGYTRGDWWEASKNPF